MCALHPRLRSFRNVALKQFYCSSDWRWPFFVFWRKIVSRALVLSTPLNSRRFSALCPQVVFQDPPHFFKTQINCYSCFSRQSLLCPSPSLHRALGSTATAFCKGGRWTLTHATLSFPFHFSLFVTRSLTLRGWWHVWSVTPWDNTAECMCHCLKFHCHAGGWDRIVCTVFMDSVRTLLDNKAPPLLVFVDWASVCFVRSCSLPFLWMRSLIGACWPLLTELSQVFWQECLVETPESVWVPFPLCGLLELCQLAYLQYWFLCLTHPRLSPSQSASLVVVLSSSSKCISNEPKPSMTVHVWNSKRYT